MSLPSAATAVVPRRALHANSLLPFAARAAAAASLAHELSPGLPPPSHHTHSYRRLTTSAQRLAAESHAATTEKPTASRVGPEPTTGRNMTPSSEPWLRTQNAAGGHTPATPKSSATAGAAGTAAPASAAVPATPRRSYNPIVVAMVKGLAKLMGYNSTTSSAIRVTSDLYDKCAARADDNAAFWYGVCGLPRTYQTWFQITNLHVWLLLVRLRSLPRSQARAYSQELVNHFFIDAEMRMRRRFGVQTARLVKGYMREMHNQHRGAVLGLDEALACTHAELASASSASSSSSASPPPSPSAEIDEDADARLAAAIWRNVWGGGWGVVGGVKRKLRGVDKVAPDEDASAAEGGTPELAYDRGQSAMGPDASSYAQAAAEARAAKLGERLPASGVSDDELAARALRESGIDVDAEGVPPRELGFPLHLARVTEYCRRELARLASLSDAEVLLGRVASARTLPPQHASHMREAAAASGEGEGRGPGEVDVEAHGEATARSANVGGTEVIERVGSKPQHHLDGTGPARSGGVRGGGGGGGGGGVGLAPGSAAPHRLEGGLGSVAEFGRI